MGAELVDRRERVIWAAGFFDGEGSVAIKFHRTRGQYCIRINAVQVTEPPLLILQSLFGGKIRVDGRQSGGNWRSRYVWNCETQKALRALREMRPWLVVKAPHADLAEEFAAALAPHGGAGRGWDKTEQAAIFARMTGLNARGKAAS
jgi:hypothetical protein